MRILTLLVAALTVLGAVSATTYYCPVTGRYFDDSTARGQHCGAFVDKNGDGYCDNLQVLSEETSDSSAETTSTSSTNTSEQQSSTASTTSSTTSSTAPVGLVAVIAGLVVAAVLLRRL
ncbi:hypothetical protein [Methanopyrus kandleri]|uniref:Uncharacterized protein n=1 Tax=Methanopyrus kandleri (strain AV19 / DSM 6324 / JCM 9639 / NBRC 100938) TaxID=190192 RepID=Q8TW51_METKA|nr:hypothetical protein [Methanopyrus kandleri]AAM02398.1 Uncharacterized protein MK1185 [Methanopyrus kandleri AV19]